MAPPVTAPTASSRVIVKNLPKHATKERLQEFFAAVGEVTDCRLQKTKSGISRQFAFVGFRRETDAAEAVKRLNRTFFDTAKVIVESAHAPGSDSLARPWSRHAVGSSAHKKLERNASKANVADPVVAAAATNVKKSSVGKTFKTPGSRIVKTSIVKPTKAGVSGNRVHLAFDSSDDETGQTRNDSEQVLSMPVPARAKNDVAFDDSIDDLAYLRAKTNASKAQAERVVEQDESDEEASEDDDKEIPDAEAEEEAKETTPNRSALIAMKDDVSAAAENDAAAALLAAGAGGVRRTELSSADRAELEDSGRLYVTNLPYGATEEDLRAHCETLGEVSSVYICKDEDTGKSRGFGYVTYVFPEFAVRALAELDMASFQGRLLRFAAAQAKPEAAAVVEAEQRGGKGKSAFRKERELKKKKVEAHLEHTWNLLYVSANAAVDAAAAQLGVSKSALLGKDAENPAVSAALAETSLIRQTKSWLQREGIRVDAFEQSGSALQSCKSNLTARRDDTFIVKHLPSGTTSQELRERFARYGELVRCSLAPAGTVAIVQYTDKGSAQRSFQKLAFSRFLHVPLYLEWAPEGVFEERALDETEGGATGSKSRASAAEEEDEIAEDGPRGCLFVKNLNFATTEEGLKAAFGRAKGFRFATVMRKTAAVSKGGLEQKNGKDQSMGYGFLEFDTPASAAECLRSRQGAVVDGHALQLQISQRNALRSQAASGAGKKVVGAVSSPRLCVRNLAFEANRKELAQLFGAYGSLTAVRMPKKSDHSGHRGFAFIDFASKAEAAAAFEALQHTHLYGRRMVIEPAEEKANDVGTVLEATQKRQANLELKSEARKRRKAALLRTDSGAFKDAFE